MTFHGKDKFSPCIPAAAVAGTKISPWAFIIAFTLSVGTVGESFALQKTVDKCLQYRNRGPFILIRDGRLAIDYHSYGNLSDQLNLHLRSLSRLSRDLIIPKCIKLKSFWGGGERATADEVGWWVPWLCQVQSGACCWGVQHVTPWQQLISRWAVNGGAGQEALLQRVKEEDDAAACLPSLSLGAVIKRITSLTVGQCGMTSQSTPLQC